MTARRKLPPFAKQLAEARAAGLVPRLLGGVHVCIVLAWDEHRTGAVYRIVMPDDPTTYDLRSVSGLHVRLAFTGNDAHRVAAAIDAILAAGPSSLETVNNDLREAGAPRAVWLAVFVMEGLRHAA